MLYWSTSPLPEHVAPVLSRRERRYIVSEEQDSCMWVGSNECECEILFPARPVTAWLGVTSERNLH
jgi:hypothetical protein